MESTKNWKQLAKNFGRLQQNVITDPTRKWNLLVIWREGVVKEQDK